MINNIVVVTLHIHINIHKEQVDLVKFTELITISLVKTKIVNKFQKKKTKIVNKAGSRKEMLTAVEDWPYDPERKSDEDE